MPRRSPIILNLLAAPLLVCAAAEQVDIDIVYPPGANVFNVVSDGGIDPSGASDVTAALQKLLARCHGNGVSTLYFPRGTYLVSGSLLMKVDRSRSDASHSHGPWIVGESRSGTVIRLKDGTWPKPEYDLLADRKGKFKTIDRQVVLNTGDCTNTTFNKVVRNLTINTGRGNAGAIGVQYNTSNTGFLGEVTIISEDGQGLAALALAGVENGPAQIRNLRTRGFDIGIYAVTAYTCAGSQLLIEEPNRLGILNQGILACDDVVISMSKPGPAIRNHGTLSLVGGSCTGSSPEDPAIPEAGALYLRDCCASGFAGLLKGGAAAVAEHGSGKAHSLFGQPAGSLALPVKPTPMVPYEKDLARWADPRDYGAVGDGKADDTAAVQAALSDQAKTHLILPWPGKGPSPVVRDPAARVSFRVTKPLRVGPSIQRIVGAPGKLSSSFPDQVVLEIGEGSAPVVVIESASLPPIRIRTDRTVVLSSLGTAYPFESLEREGVKVRGEEAFTGIYCEGGGEVFINNCHAPFQVLNPKQRVWIRHYNNEQGIWAKMSAANVKAGTAWMLGWKTEGLGNRVTVGPAGTCELLGFNHYDVNRKPVEGSPFIATIEEGGRFSAPLIVQNGTRAYRSLVVETRGGETRTLDREAAGGKNLGLYTTLTR